MDLRTTGAAAVTQDGGVRQGLGVLVVDDHRDSANAVVRLLQGEGHEAVAAYGYAEALDRARSAGPFDVVVTDVRLSDGDGVEMLGAMGDARIGRAIVVSGCAAQEEIGRARQAGCQDYLVKPIQLGALLEAVGRGTTGDAANRLQ